MKRKRRQRLTTIGLSIISLLFLIVSMVGPFLNNQLNNASNEAEISTPSLTYELFEGEEILYVAEGFPSDFDNELRITGGDVTERPFTDNEGISRTEITMVIFIEGEGVVAYEGLEFDHENYHIRVLKIGERGFANLAISANQ